MTQIIPLTNTYKKTKCQAKNTGNSAELIKKLAKMFMILFIKTPQYKNKTFNQLLKHRQDHLFLFEKEV